MANDSTNEKLNKAKQVLARAKAAFPSAPQTNDGHSNGVSFAQSQGADHTGNILPSDPATKVGLDSRISAMKQLLPQ